MGVVVSLDGKSSPAPSLDALLSLTKAGMEGVNRMILSRVGSDVEMIPEIAKHLIESGGKRLRPMLTLATAELCGYKGEGDVKLAAAVEFMHTATLLHDDVVDDSEMRRGKLAARMLWGNEASVLVGDFLLGQAFKMMVEVGSLHALDVLSTAATVIAEGEVFQLAVAKNTFQLIDDALDYGGVSSKLGKNLGDDFREGKITLPVVLSFRRGSESERAFWKRALEQGETGDTELTEAMAIMKKHRAIEDTIERAKHYGAMARDALALFADTPMKAAMLEAVDFCISRAH